MSFVETPLKKTFNHTLNGNALISLTYGLYVKTFNTGYEEDYFVYRESTY
jgi:hypothetical protein